MLQEKMDGVWMILLLKVEKILTHMMDKEMILESVNQPDTFIFI